VFDLRVLIGIGGVRAGRAEVDLAILECRQDFWMQPRQRQPPLNVTISLAEMERNILNGFSALDEFQECTELVGRRQRLGYASSVLLAGLR